MQAQKIKARSENLSGSPLPFYYQIASLARQYGVSRPTIRNAKAMLEDEGYIHSIKGSGCYVNGHKTWKTQPPTVDNLNDIFHYGTRMSFRIHEFGMVSNTAEIKNELKNPQDRFVFQIRGTRWFHGVPISYVVYYLPFRFGSRIPLESLDENPFIPQLEKMAGIRVIEGIQNIAMGRANARVAKHLGLKKGNAVLVVKTVYFDESRQPIEYVETKYKGELPYSIRVKRN